MTSIFDTAISALQGRSQRESTRSAYLSPISS